MGGRRLYSCYFVWCCFQDLFDIARSILVQFLSSFFSMRFVNINVVHPYRRIDTTTVWKKLRLILSDKSDFHMINNISITVPAFAWRILILHEKLQAKYINLFTNFREPPFRVEMSPYWVKHMYSVLSTFTWSPMQLGFGLGRCICQKRYVICVVCVRNSLWGVSSASCFKTIFFH